VPGLTGRFWACLQVLSTLYSAETRRMDGARNVLQVWRRFFERLSRASLRAWSHGCLSLQNRRCTTRS
jgi:hypothetical protein